MLTYGKLTFFLEVLVFLLCEFYPKLTVGDASLKNNKPKVVMKYEDHSSNQISVDDEENLVPENEQLYYLPTQTMYSTTEDAAGGFSTTSPPRLTINPAPIKTSYQQNTIAIHEGPVGKDNHHINWFPSHCVSETPAVELKSEFLLPSQSLLTESVIMSGHLEIASKTNPNGDITKNNNIASQPSIVLQGTVLYPNTVTDM